MKNGFSLLELIFVIVVMGIIASFAVPKYMDTRDQALASTIQRDIVTAINSFQSYYLINRKISNISDVITLNTKNWAVSENSMVFSDSDEPCVEIKIEDEKIKINLFENTKDVCEELKDRGIVTQEIDLI